MTGMRTGFMYYEETKEFIETNGGDVYLKYVRIVNLSSSIAYRFGDAQDTDHKVLAGEKEVISAGFVSIRAGELFVEGHSMTLKAGPMVDDDQNISELLGITIKD